MRFCLVLTLMILLVACGEQEVSPVRGDAEVPPAPGPFSLRIDAPGLPGQPAPLRIGGDAAGVTVRIRRAAAPLELFESWFVPVSPLTPPPRWDDAIVIKLDGEVEPEWPTLAPGLHLVTATRGDTRSIGLLPITDLDLIIRRGADEVLVFVLDSWTGTARPNARVSILGAQDRRTGRADGQGVFRAAVRPGPEMQVIAFSGERIGVGSSSEVPGNGEADLSVLQMDQGPCAPGTEVGFAGVLRVRSDGRVRPYPTDDAAYVVTRGEETVAEGMLEVGPAGTVRSAFYVPKQVGDGPITFNLSFGRHSIIRELSVRRPFPPPFTVEVVADAPEPEPGARSRFLVRALLADRAPLAGFPARYSVLRDGRPVLSGEGVLDDSGELHISVMLSGEGEVEVAAEVTGPDDQVKSDSLLFGLRPETAGIAMVPFSRILELGQTAAVRVVAAGGGPVVGHLEVGAEVHAFRIEAKERETIVRFVPAMPGRHSIEMTAKDRDGRQLRATEELFVIDALPIDWHDGIALVADRDEVQAGEVVSLLLLLPSELRGCGILETLEGRSLGQHHAGTRLLPQQVIRFRVPGNQGDSVRYRVSGMRGGKIQSAEVTLRVRPKEEDPGIARTRRVVSLHEDLRNPAGAGVFARVVTERGDAYPSLVLFSTPTGSLSPWLRTDADGRTEVWRPTADTPVMVKALIVGLDGSISRQSIRFDPVDDGSEPPPIPPRKSWTTPERVESFELELAAGRTERWIVLSAEEDLGATAVRIQLTATRRSKLVPALARLAEQPSGSTVSHLLPLLRLAAATAFGEEGLDSLPGLSADVELAKRSLLDLLHQRLAAGGWGHLPGDAPDPDLTSLVRKTIAATELLGEEFTLAEPSPPERTTALVAAWECHDLLAEIPAGPSGEPRETLVRVRVNNAIVGTTRLVHGKPDREYGFLAVPAGHLRPGNNLLQIDTAGQPGVTATVSIARPRTVPRSRSPLALKRTFVPGGPVRRGSRLDAELIVTSKVPLRRVLIRCPIPAGAQLAAHPELPAGVTFEERAEGIVLFVRKLSGSLKLTLPLVVLLQGTFDVDPARAILIEDLETWAQSEGDTLLFR